MENKHINQGQFVGSHFGTTAPPSIHYNGADWKITRGLGSVRRGGTLMGRQFGTGRQLSSTPKRGKALTDRCSLLPVTAAELLLSKGRRQAAQL